MWRTDDQTAENDSGQPVQAAFEHCPTVSSKHVPAVKLTPDSLELVNSNAVVASLTGKDDCVDCASRRATDYRERIAGPRWHQLRNGLENTDLKCTTGPAAGQNQRRIVACDTTRHSY